MTHDFNRPAYSVKELVITIAVLGFLVALLVPAVQKTREAAARTQVINNLKQVLLSIHAVNDVYKKLPPASGTFGAMKEVPQSLSIHINPYVEASSLYSRIYNSGKAPTDEVIPPYTAPLDFTTTDFQRVQNFAANVRVFTDAGVQTLYSEPVTTIKTEADGRCTSSIPATFKDGTSYTILLATRFANHTAVGSGGNVNCSAYDTLVTHDNSAFFGVNPLTGPVTALSTGGWQLAPTLAEINCQFGAVAHGFSTTVGIQVGLADADVRTIAPSISREVWNRLMQPNDGGNLEWDGNQARIR